MIALRCARVIRGINTPLFVAVTSSMAEAWGFLVPIPTWAITKRFSISNAERMNVFLILKYYKMNFRVVNLLLIK